MTIPFPFIIWLWPLVVLGWLTTWIESWAKIERAEIQAATQHAIFVGLHNLPPPASG